MEVITGILENIVFSNTENGFTVAKIQENNKKELTCIVGNLTSLTPGETVVLQGEWKHHPHFGRQFAVAAYEVKSPSDVVGIQKYLASGLIKGIGPIYAQKIVDTFGIDTLKIIDDNPNALLQVEGIGKKRIKQIMQCWQEQKSIREVMIFLRSFDISPAYAQKIYKKYENQSITLIKENPYRLAKDIFGIGFLLADTIAKKMGFTDISSFRIQAGIEYNLWQMTNEGHTCYPKDLLIETTANILHIEKDLVDKQIPLMIAEQKIYQKQLLHDNKKTNFIWLGSFFHFENKIADEIFRLQHAFSSCRDINVKKAVEWVEKQLHLQFSEDQKKAIGLALEEKFHIITGGPGTGKSTITKAIIEITEKITTKITLAAPTGRAAKRMSQITKRKASTIHSLLEYDFISKKFRRNTENPLHCKLLIIDEASMIDTMLMYHLLKAISDDTRVLLLGDIDQLPSVGAGNILKDIIASEKVSLSYLTQIYRQARGSKIITNAHKINQGIFPYIDNDHKSDFLFFPEKEKDAIIGKILQLVKEDLPKAKKFDPVEDIQVLSPMKKGVIGGENLNVLLQQTLNPSSDPFLYGGRQFHLHDKVMQIRNNYNKLIFNGDIGRISHIDRIEQEMVINFDGRLIIYNFSELDEIVLAYAVSVHKYQGSECPCIIMPLHMSHFKLLFRNLLYTAVTRAKKLVILVGSKQALGVSIKNVDVRQRYTGLQKFLQEKFSKEHTEKQLFPLWNNS